MGFASSDDSDEDTRLPFLRLLYTHYFNGSADAFVRAVEHEYKKFLVVKVIESRPPPETDL